jgi:hypothetical protein
MLLNAQVVILLMHIFIRKYTFLWSITLQLYKQALYLLSHTPALFALAVFEMGSHFKPWQVWTLILLFVLPHS